MDKQLSAIMEQESRNIPELAGRVVELWYVPHWTIKPEWPQDGSVFISHYLYSPGGGAAPSLTPQPRSW